MNNIRQVALFLLSAFLFWGCATLEEAGIERGQTVFNRVNFRTYKANKISYTNRMYGGILIPAGTECTLKNVSHKAITFIVNGDEYVLKDWLGVISAEGATSVENVRVSFEKFFVENKEKIGLDKINPAFRESILAGIPELEMSKEEVLLSLGYPAFLGKNDRTWDDDRERILAHNDWYYRKTSRRSILLRFRSEKLAQIIGNW
jgi:hypothetical protein